MIATVDDLEAIALDDQAEVGALNGWRRDLFGSKALELKHGRLALTLDRGKVVDARMAGKMRIPDLGKNPGNRYSHDRRVA